MSTDEWHAAECEDGPENCLRCARIAFDRETDRLKAIADERAAYLASIARKES